MERHLFEQLVTEALDTLPDVFLERLDNVEVVVEDWPSQEIVRRAGVRSAADVLGFYHGVPQTKRTHDYGLVLPDRISIYQRSIEMHARTPEDIRRMIQRTLRHEIAHHFGIDDERLRELGAY
jgi:predicted Zn-dependent protease with MMP-like domain